MKKIILFSFCMLAYNYVSATTTFNVMQPKGTISVLNNSYVDNMNYVYEINLPDNVNIGFDCYVMLEGYDYDYLEIYDIDNDGNAHLLLAVGNGEDETFYDGFYDGVIYTSFANGKARVVFRSDGSVSGPDNGYDGFELNYFPLSYSISYTYDAAGNRTGVTGLKAAHMSIDDSTHVIPLAKLQKEEISNLMQVKISPNPTSGILKVELQSNNTDSKFHVIVFDTGMRKIMSKHVTGNELVIDLSDKPSGVYVVRASIAKNVEVFKVVKL